MLRRLESTPDSTEAVNKQRDGTENVFSPLCLIREQPAALYVITLTRTRSDVNLGGPRVPTEPMLLERDEATRDLYHSAVIIPFSTAVQLHVTFLFADRFL